MTLIELVVAITLLSIVMTALAAFIGISLKSVQLGRARQVAEAAANKRLEELRDVDYPQLALASAAGAQQRLRQSRLLRLRVRATTTRATARRNR